MFDNMTTSCSELTKSLTREEVEEAFRVLEECHPEYHEIRMTKNTLDFLISKGLKFDEKQPYIKIDEFIPDNFILGMWMGELKSIIKVSSDSWKIVDVPDAIGNIWNKPFRFTFGS